MMPRTKVYLQGYEKTDRNGNKYFFVKSADVDMLVNLKEFVIFVFPYKQNKVELCFCPAQKVVDENNSPDD